METSTPQFKVGINVANDAMAGTEKVCELYFTDAIYNKVNYWTGEEQSMLADVIKQVNEIKPTKIIQYIDSWGGSAPVGFGIYNYLKGHTAKVETKILNNCASIATVMSSAGNKGKITMPRNGMMVIHQAQNSAQGTAADLREAADVCDKYTENVLDVYVQNNRKGKTHDELYNLIKDGDYWMTGTEAKEMGFVDDCYNDASITITNSIALAKTVYNNIPQRILAMAEAEVPTKDDNLFTRITNFFSMKVDEIVAKFKADLPNNDVVGTGDSAINLVAMLEEPITNLLNAVQAQMAADITNASTTALTQVTDGVTKVENKYKEILDDITAKMTEIITSLATVTETVTAQAATIVAQAETIAKHDTAVTNYAKNITDLTADVRNQAGRATPAAGAEDSAGGSGRKTFAGRTRPLAVGD